MRLILTSLIFVVLLAHGNEVERYEENGRVGLKNKQGQVVLPATFEALGWSDGSFSVRNNVTGYKQNGRWGLITLKKDFITPAEYESLVPSQTDRVIAGKYLSAISLKVGCLTLEGKVSIPFVYDAITLYGLRAVVMEKRGAQFLFGLTDLDNKSLLPVKFKSLYPVGSLRFAVQNAEGKLGLFSDRGDAITDFSIDSIGTFYRDRAIVFSNGLQGLINREGDMLVKPQYSHIELGETAKGLLPGDWRVLSSTNQELKRLQADALLPYTHDKFHVIQAGRHGLVDAELKLILPMQYEAIEPLKQGAAAVKLDGRWGLLNETGAMVIPAAYDSLWWNGTVALVKKSSGEKSRWYFLTASQVNRQSAGYDWITPLQENYFLIGRQGYVGLADNLGNEKLHCVYDSIFDVQGNLVAVQFKQHNGVVTLEEHWVLPPQPNKIKLINDDVYIESVSNIHYMKSWAGSIIYFTANPFVVHQNFLLESLPNGETKWLNWAGQEIRFGNGIGLRAPDMPLLRDEEGGFYNGLQRFESQGKFGFRDQQGRLTIPNRYDSVRHFSEGLAAFKLLGKWGYLDVHDKIVVNPTYEMADYFNNGYARVSAKGKYGLIDRQGNLSLTPQYDYIVKQGDFYLIQQQGLVGLATTQGRVLVQPRYDAMTVLPNGQLLVKLNDRYGVLSIDGLNIIPIMYHALQFDTAKQVFLAFEKPRWVQLR